MVKHDAGWWAERVAEFERTGDAERIARRDRVTVRLLKWWRWRLRSAPPMATTGPSAQRHRGEQRLLPVIVAPGATALSDHAADASTIIETARGRVSIRGALSPEQLAAIVAELVREC